MRINVPAGTIGLSRPTVLSFGAVRLFSDAREVSLVVEALPFHGQGATLSEAEEDLVAAMEETLDELQCDVEGGIELSPHLLKALHFVRHVFGVDAE